MSQYSASLIAYNYSAHYVGFTIRFDAGNFIEAAQKADMFRQGMLANAAIDCVVVNTITNNAISPEEGQSSAIFFMDDRISLLNNLAPLFKEG
jgi:hypothetical protein